MIQLNDVIIKATKQEETNTQLHHASHSFQLSFKIIEVFIKSVLGTSVVDFFNEVSWEILVLDRKIYSR